MPRVAVDLLSYTGTKGGMETYARELYRHIGALDADIEYVGLCSKEGYQLDNSWFPGEMIDTGISGEQRFIWAWGELYGLNRWLKRTGADLLHCPALLGPARTSIPVVLTLHDMLYWSHPQHMTVPLYTRPVMWMERKAAKNATRIITISEVSAGEIQRFLGLPATSIDVVPLAGTAMNVVRAEQPDGPPFVLATGNRRPHKNWASLIRALPLVPEQVRPRLVITGGRGDDPLQPVVAEVGMEAWVDLKGWVSADEMRDLFERANVLAMPSLCEGSCLPALEAMMAGLPVMLSDIPVYREVGGDAALYFDPYSLESIAETMAIVTTEHERMRHMVERGYQQASLFSWDRVAHETLDVFRSALGTAAD